MQVTIIGRHREVPQSVKEYIERKLEKLPRFYDRVMTVEVIIDGQARRNSVEIVAYEFVAQESGDDVHACFDVCFGKIERQIRRHKHRLRNRKRAERPERFEQ